MSDARGPLPPSSIEAAWLRENWNESALGRFRNMWIAVKGGGVASSSADLEDLLERTIGFDPLYAFVDFEPRQ